MVWAHNLDDNQVLSELKRLQENMVNYIECAKKSGFSNETIDKALRKLSTANKFAVLEMECKERGIQYDDVITVLNKAKKLRESK